MGWVNHMAHSASPKQGRAAVWAKLHPLMVLQHLDQLFHFLLNAWLPNQKLMILPTEVTGVMGSIAGIADLAKAGMERAAAEKAK